jgi:hypothetical protein
MTAAADRHLLFGLLALQNGLIVHSEPHHKSIRPFKRVAPGRLAPAS